MSTRVPSSPYFFRPVKLATLLGTILLLVLAALLPAPLESPADPAHPPNPAKSAWFLLWIQELVSYNTRAIWIAVTLSLALVALPWLPLQRGDRAAWFPREQRLVSAAVLLASLLVLALTTVGLFLRGSDWRLVLPF